MWEEEGGETQGSRAVRHSGRKGHYSASILLQALTQPPPPPHHQPSQGGWGRWYQPCSVWGQRSNHTRPLGRAEALQTITPKLQGR